MPYCGALCSILCQRKAEVITKHTHVKVDLQDSLDNFFLYTLMFLLLQLSDLLPSETGFIVSADRLPNITLLTLIATL